MPVNPRQMIPPIPAPKPIHSIDEFPVDKGILLNDELILLEKLELGWLLIELLVELNVELRPVETFVLDRLLTELLKLGC